MWQNFPFSLIMFFNIKPKFFCEMRLLERRSGNMTCFFFLSYPFSVLQNEGCVYCALGCVMTISKSCFCSLWRYSTHTSLSINSKDHDRNNLLFCQPFLHVRASLASVFWRLKPSCWEGPQCSPATTTNMDSLVQLSSFNTQLKTHFFLNLHLTGGLLLL